MILLLRAALTIQVGAARFFLLLLVKPALIPIGPELDAGYPRRGPPHLLTNGVQRYLRAALDNELIMDVPDDLAVA